ncbi:MAG: hypothetical protein ACTHL8_19755 [Burkholderiaceae bacterium]
MPVRPRPSRLPLPATIAAIAAGLVAASGADDIHAAAASGPAPTGTAAASGPELARRAEAARAAAAHDPACVAVQPFYWSVGDAGGMQADGREGRHAPAAETKMPVASASKWVYAAYVVQQRQGSLSADDVRFLTLTSGYTDFRFCLRGQTVEQCDRFLGNGRHVAANDGRFDYGGGHMQRHAVLDALGPDDDAALAAHVNAALGTAFAYAQPQLAGGLRATPAQYGVFLQGIVGGRLDMRAALGTHAVCTDPATCPTAVYSPAAPLALHYSIGHWVEDEPGTGDGAFSSAGAFGFYPWISADKAWWGVVARVDHRRTAAMDSARCGRRIRAAWLAG